MLHFKTRGWKMITYCCLSTSCCPHYPELTASQSHSIKAETRQNARNHNIRSPLHYSSLQIFMNDNNSKWWSFLTVAVAFNDTIHELVEYYVNLERKKLESFTAGHTRFLLLFQMVAAESNTLEELVAFQWPSVRISWKAIGLDDGTRIKHAVASRTLNKRRVVLELFRFAGLASWASFPFLFPRILVVIY